MAAAGFMWECKCGHIEYGEEAPEECPECFAIGSFVQLPEEIMKEREKELGGESLEEKEILRAKKSKAKTAAEKAKKKVKESKIKVKPKKKNTRRKIK